MEEDENIVEAFLDGYHDVIHIGLDDEVYHAYLAGLCTATVDRYIEKGILFDFNVDLATSSDTDCCTKHDLSRIQYLF